METLWEPQKHLRRNLWVTKYYHKKNENPNFLLNIFKMVHLVFLDYLGNITAKTVIVNIFISYERPVEFRFVLKSAKKI